ncbi:MAG: large conductance mechanosensitive channel protein MscL [Lachnospiraceae bacterium]|nr:large conductance mechanosensitive channel protein MscL [Lachnospiraceae bacterium]
MGAAEKGKGFIKEFKEFALKGNVMDMAVGVIIGGAFGSIVSALTNDFINPLINSIGGAEVAGQIRLPWVDYTGLDSEAAAALSLNYGDFITSIINFLIMALCIFLMVKAVNKLTSLGKKKEEAPAAPTTKICPFCRSEIAIEATRCPHCTSEIKE